MSAFFGPGGNSEAFKPLHVCKAGASQNLSAKEKARCIGDM